MKRVLLVMLSLLFIATGVYAEDSDVTITIPGYDVVLNGMIVDNEQADYPFITYKDITYIPMTYDLTAAIGLTTKWSSETGLEISKADKAIAHNPSGTSKNKAGKKYRASIVTFPVKVNGQEIDNLNEEYPLLLLKNVTYFPMTYRFMVTEFNSGIDFTSEKGLNIAVDNKLKLELPQPVIESVEIITAEFEEMPFVIGDYYKINNGLQDDLTLDYDFTEREHLDKYLTVTVDYYDESGELMLTAIEINGLRVGYGRRDVETYAHITKYDNVSKMKVNFIYEDMLTVASKVKAVEDQAKIFVDVTDITADMLKNLDVEYAKYQLGYLEYSNSEYTDLDLKYNAIIAEYRGVIDGEKKDYYTVVDINNVTTAEVKDNGQNHSFFKVPKDVGLRFVEKQYGTKIELYKGESVYKDNYGTKIYFYDKDINLVAIALVNPEK